MGPKAEAEATRAETKIACALTMIALSKLYLAMLLLDSGTDALNQFTDSSGNVMH